MNEIRNFDRVADSYDQLAEPQAALARTLASWLTPAERRGRAVEFGAGTGFLTQRLVPWIGTYLATDASPAMKLVGQTRCPFNAWARRDARMPEGLGPVNWVLSCNLLQWFEDPGLALKAWREEMAPDGELAVAVLVRGTFSELLALLPEAMQVRWRSGAEWEQIVRDAGFVPNRIERWEYTSKYPCARDFLRAVHGMGLAPRRVVGPGKLRTTLGLYDEIFGVGGTVRATWRGWLARARRA